MRIFLFKSVIYALSFVSIFLLYFILKFNLSKGDQFYFVSNSISFNAKARFLEGKDLSKIDYFVIGSSLSLNNIDGKRLEDFYKVSVMNASSWGMKLIDFKELLPLISPHSKIIVNMGFTDIGISSLQKYEGYPVDNKYRWKNAIPNLKTYNAQLNQIQEYTGSDAFKSYQNLHFDRTGSVQLGGEDFKISAVRWDDSPVVPSAQDLSNFIKLLEFLNRYEVYMFFSPERLSHKSQEKFLAVERIKKDIESRYSNIKFVNNYQLNFADSMFVDCTHFSKSGAERYTEIICQQLGFSRPAVTLPADK